jgi:TATA-box binding protein (TBP) (component of TFIID and TFIIIB)
MKGLFMNVHLVLGFGKVAICGNKTEKHLQKGIDKATAELITCKKCRKLLGLK